MKTKSLPPSRRSRRGLSRLVRVLAPSLAMAVGWRLLLRRFEKREHVEVIPDGNKRKSRKLLAFIAVSVLGAVGVRALLVRGLAVHPRARGRGLARRLLARAEELAHGAGCRFVMLFSAPWRRAAHNLYRKSGFRAVLPGVFWKGVGGGGKSAESR